MTDYLLLKFISNLRFTKFALLFAEDSTNEHQKWHIQKLCQLREKLLKIELALEIQQLLNGVECKQASVLKVTVLRSSVFSHICMTSPGGY